MGKNVHDDVLDAALAILSANSHRLVICTSEPTGASAYTNAMTAVDSSGFKLASITIDSTDFTGPAEGDTSGRKIAVDAQVSLSVDGVVASGSAGHVALVKYHASSVALQDVLYVTTCTAQSLTGGNKVNTPAWDIEIRDPA